MDDAGREGGLGGRIPRLGRPLLSLRIGEWEVSLHRPDLAAEGAPPVATLWVVAAERGGLSTAPIAGPWHAVHVNKWRVICGQLPTGAVDAVALVDGGDHSTVHLAAGVFMTKVPLNKNVRLSFRDSAGEVLVEHAIPAVPPLPGWPTRLRWWLQEIGWLPTAKGITFYSSSGTIERRRRWRR